MLCVGIMALLVLRLLGIAIRLGGSSIHLLLAAAAVLFVIKVLRSSAPKFHPQKPLVEPMQGRINWIDTQKDWGSIECADGIDLLFHSSSFESSERDGLHEGDNIEFTLEEPRTSVAKRVLRIKVLRHWA